VRIGLALGPLRSRAGGWRVKGGTAAEAQAIRAAAIPG
jgi:hypothetical protein